MTISVCSILLYFEESIRSTGIPLWTAGQQMKRSILGIIHDKNRFIRPGSLRPSAESWPKTPFISCCCLSSVASCDCSALCALYQIPVQCKNYCDWWDVSNIDLLVCRGFSNYEWYCRVPQINMFLNLPCTLVLDMLFLTNKILPTAI